MTEAADAPQELSKAELQDVTNVVIADTAAESIFLIQVLEDADIPAVTRENGVPGFGGNQGVRVLVPRVLLEPAKLAIAQARIQAEQRGVEAAFEPDSISDSTDNMNQDPLLQEMLFRRELDDDDKAVALKIFIKKWLADEMKAAETAKYLAAAGLNIHEAEALVECVKKEHAEHIQNKRADRRFLVNIVVIIFIVLFLLSVKMSPFSRGGKWWFH